MIGVSTFPTSVHLVVCTSTILPGTYLYFVATHKKYMYCIACDVGCGTKCQIAKL